MTQCKGNVVAFIIKKKSLGKRVSAYSGKIIPKGTDIVTFITNRYGSMTIDEFSLWLAEHVPKEFISDYAGKLILAQKL